MKVINRFCYLFFIGIMLTLFLACNKHNITANHAPLAAQNLMNVAYVPDPLQKMDVYLPVGRDTIHTKVLMLIHGGAWTSGDKTDFDTAILTLQNSLPNFALCNINSRLATIQGANVWPTQLSDINSAFQSLQQQQAKYVINTSQSAVFGASAGAQLALLLGYTHSDKIKAIIDLFGHTDLAALYYNAPNLLYPSLLSIFLNGTPATNMPAYISASPLYLVNTSKLPLTIIFHGTADDVVPISQSDSLNNRLSNYDITHQYIQYAGAGHGGTGVNLIDTYNKSIQFLQQIMPN
ncbi:MAG: alpha/beta hydrolase [Sphingobacteriales bacterium]|uniref:alpha/beta hydrolase n=1 Tax=Hydrotalea flava TaxID=714549 RepID=UPI000FB73DF7|nr:alpha/beta hydrolase [Hydrotalea flava]RTL50995.1 MAG: alpha/beta hydrolase [Sphingobacteriales bacterium]